MKILITGGGTQTPIDRMRFIGNKSSGRTAISLAHEFSQEHEVVLFMASDIPLPQNFKYNVKKFVTSYDLIDLIENSVAEKFDLIIHAAAINDYEVIGIYSKGELLENSKIPSGLEDLEIKLKPAPKVINLIKRSYPEAALIGFKLSGDLSEQEIKVSVARVLDHSQAQAIVQNNISERQRGLDTFTVFDPSLKEEKINGFTHLSQAILKLGVIP